MDDTVCQYLTIGQRDKAHQALRARLAEDDSDAAARRALEELERQLTPSAGGRHIHLPIFDDGYVVFAKSVVTIGRKPDNDIPIINTDISRHHARVSIQDRECVVEDLGSRNGTRLNGLRIQRAAVAHNRDAVSFGRHTHLDVGIQQRSAGLSVALTPRDDQFGLARRYILFSDAMFIGVDVDCELPLLASVMPAALPYLFKIVYRAPYWYVHIHPHARHVSLNTIPVAGYVVIVPGDTLSVEGFPLVFG
jgi:hypothetical protein